MTQCVGSLSKDEFRKEFLDLFITAVEIDLRKGITFILTPFTDKLWEAYEIKRKEPKKE